MVTFSVVCQIGRACIEAERDSFRKAEALKTVIGRLTTTRLNDALDSNWKTDHRFGLLQIDVPTGHLFVTRL
ncbi:hypothetical protein [Thalassospira australica]|uniref:hypothetical protein n=1 Tax=Thalassospira australica TaxID=1528106 RepID=UPI00384CC3A9